MYVLSNAPLKFPLLTHSQKDEGLIVADLGGGTLDFSAYNIVSRSPVVFHESAPAKCESSPFCAKTG